MISQDEWKLRGRALAEAVTPVMGIAHRCRSGNAADLHHALVLNCLLEPLRYFREQNKPELVASIELLLRILETGGDPRTAAEEVMQCVGRAYPTT